MTDIMLADMDAWEAFALANEAALVDQYGSVERALKHACDGGLELGGAVIYFDDAFGEDY